MPTLITVNRTEPLNLAGWPGVLEDSARQLLGPSQYNIEDLVVVKHPKQVESQVTVSLDEVEGWLHTQGLLHRCVTLHDAWAWSFGGWERTGYLPLCIGGSVQEVEATIMFWGTPVVWPRINPVRSIMGVEYSQRFASRIPVDRRGPYLDVRSFEDDGHPNFLKPWEPTLIFPE